MGSFVSLFKRLAQNEKIRELLPPVIEQLIRSHLPVDKYLSALRTKQLKQIELKSTYDSRYTFRLGILVGLDDMAIRYVNACKENGVSYQLFDVFSPNWISEIQNSECDLYITWLTERYSAWKELVDDRIYMLTNVLGKKVYPTVEATWIYGSKYRMIEWLEVHGFPHPATRIFYLEDKAHKYLETVKLPVVVKLNQGAASSGVWIIKNKNEAHKLVKSFFRKGLVHKGGDTRNRQWGSVFIQEYIPDADEWRAIRLGDYYFCYDKTKKGDFHSGSGSSGWNTPPLEVLDLLREITDFGKFNSMSADILKTKDNRLFVTELQTFFDAYDEAQMYVDGKPGRYTYNYDTQNWVFEDGVFCQNRCFNLRVKTIVENFEKNKK